MNNSNSSVVIDNETGFILDETTEEKLANHAAEDLFGNEENAQKTGNVISTFVDSYTRHKNSLSLDVWLNREFSSYPKLWQSDVERFETTTTIIKTVQKANDEKADLYAHLDKGKSRESWLAKKIEQGANAAGVVEVGKYAQSIDKALDDATDEMRDMILNNGQDFVVSGARQLHGFIAEADLANQFNINATTSGSTLKAEVPSITTLNSPDILIKDAAGNVVESIQVKLYQPNETGLKALAKNIETHDYGDSTIIVNKEHVEALRKKFPDLKIASEYEHDGVSMTMDDYEKHKAAQQKAQRDSELKQYDWNDASRMSIAKEIGKKMVVAAAFTAGFQGARILGRRVWNSLTGKENQSGNDDLKEFFESSIKSSANVGVQVAVSGALVVAAKSGWISVLKNTPAGEIANIAYVAIENAKCLYKFAKGEMTATETLDAMGNTTSSAVGGLYGAIEGAAFGLAFGGVGAFVGAVVGGMAGSAIGEAVYQGSKAIAKTAAKFVKSAYEGVKSVAKSVFNTVTFGLFS
ncbi:MAG: hypothetical protein WCI06_05370 [Methylococcaceae bacterium]